MDLIFYLVLAVALVVGIVALLQWVEGEMDTRAGRHERIRSKRERGRLAEKFEDIVSEIRKPRD